MKYYRHNIGITNKMSCYEVVINRSIEEGSLKQEIDDTMQIISACPELTTELYVRKRIVFLLTEF
jgi:hypothetical protein